MNETVYMTVCRLSVEITILRANVTISVVDSFSEIISTSANINYFPIYAITVKPLLFFYRLFF